ncbi:MAG: aminopeptidase, partial [Cyclobacteriaceae bacterium]
IYGLMQQNLDEGISRTIHFHWAGAYSANGDPLEEITPEIGKFYQQVLLETDYGKLAKDQKRFEDAMRDQTITVTTPAGTDISFSIGDRPVTKQSGDASAATAESARNLIDREMELPSGAIRVAPIETSVNGTIAFPDALWSDTLVTDLVLTFEQGTVVDMTATQGIETVQNIMAEAGDVAKSFREFALGMNPRLAIPETDPWIPYYGYGSGVVRLSLGDNTELGGNVTGGFVRWNFFTDATVTVGEDVWVENGKLLR